MRLSERLKWPVFQVQLALLVGEKRVTWQLHSVHGLAGEEVLVSAFFASELVLFNEGSDLNGDNDSIKLARSGATFWLGKYRGPVCPHAANALTKHARNSDRTRICHGINMVKL